MTPTDLRALAARVLAEEPSRELMDAVLIEMGWITDGKDYWRRRGSLTWQRFPPPNPLTSHDAAFAAMPAGWTYRASNDGCIHVIVWQKIEPDGIIIAHEALSLPRALTAAGLLARAVDAEQGDGA